MLIKCTDGMDKYKPKSLVTRFILQLSIVEVLYHQSRLLANIIHDEDDLTNNAHDTYKYLLISCAPKMSRLMGDGTVFLPTYYTQHKTHFGVLLNRYIKENHWT